MKRGNTPFYFLFMNNCPFPRLILMHNHAASGSDYERLNFYNNGG